MKTVHTRRGFFAVVGAGFLMATTGYVSQARGQDIQDRQGRNDNSERGSAVVYPVVYSRNSGDDTSRRTGVRSVEESLQRSGYSIISGRTAANIWRRMGMAIPSADDTASVSDLVRFGAALKARFVVSSTFDFHSRSIWVDLGPKTVSTATVDIQIVDVSSGKVVYSRDDIQGRSDEKFDVVKSGADLLITPLVTMVSGGPKTPHEQRAVQIAVIKAMRGFVRPGDESDRFDRPRDRRDDGR